MHSVLSLITDCEGRKVGKEMTLLIGRGTIETRCEFSHTSTNRSGYEVRNFKIFLETILVRLGGWGQALFVSCSQ